MPLDELQRIEIAIELDKGVSHEELARKFSTSVSELKNIAKLIFEKDVSSKQKVESKRKSKRSNSKKYKVSDTTDNADKMKELKE